MNIVKKFLKNKRILVTGGTGFIGVRLVEKLKSLGAEVDVYSRSKGLDVRDTKKLKIYIQKKYFAIYHLAGFSGSNKSKKYNLDFFESNTLSTINLSELIMDYSPSTKLILSGSRLEYGIPQYLPVDESHPTFPTSVYGLSKLASTQAALGFFKKKNLKVTIFRTSNVYGPWNNNTFQGYNVLSYLISSALKNKNLVIFGNGQQERDYIYMDDLLEFFILTLLDKKSEGEVYNLGFGLGIKMIDMVKLIIKQVGKGKVVYKQWPKELQKVETGSYISNIKKIQKKLGYKPKIDFEEGIRRSVRELL